MTPRLSRSAFAPFCCALACVLGPGSAFADTVVLTSVDDNTIIEDPAGFWSAGAAQYFFAGKVGVNGGNTLRRGALRFDLSGIPAGSSSGRSASGMAGCWPSTTCRWKSGGASS